LKTRHLILKSPNRRMRVCGVETPASLVLRWRGSHSETRESNPISWNGKTSQESTAFVKIPALIFDGPGQLQYLTEPVACDLAGGVTNYLYTPFPQDGEIVNLS
jgi:hypothetical protein